MKFRNKLQKHKIGKNFVQVTRGFEQEELISNGFILDYSEELLLLQQEYDFFTIGYVIYQNCDLRKIRHSKIEKYMEEMFAAEEVLGEIGISYQVDLTNWQTVFQSLKNLGKNVVVEYEVPESEFFTIGIIEQVDETKVYIRYFDATGRLRKKLTKVEYEYITKVEFDTRYIEIFSKHLKV